MSLRTRLTLAFVLVLALPLIAVVVLARGAVSGEARDRAAAELGAARAAIPAVHRAWQARASDLVRSAAALLPRAEHAGAFTDPASANRLAAAGRGSLSFLAVVTRDNAVVGISSVAARLLPGAELPDASGVVAQRSAARAILAEAVVSDPRGNQGSLIGGFWLDQAFLEAAVSADRGALLMVDEIAVAATGRSADAAFRFVLRGDGPLLDGRIGERDVVAVAGPIVEGVPASRLAAVTFAHRSAALGGGSGLGAGLWVALAAAIAGGALLAWMLARLVTRPLGDMAAAAQAISRGSVSGTIEARSGDEVGRLAVAFNEVLQTMQARFLELEESRDEVRRSVDRLGEVLRSTHDLSKLLSVVLETAIASVQARAGAVYLLAPSRVEIALKVGRGFDAAVDHRTRLGEGIAGYVAETRRAVLNPSASESPPAADWEPQEPTALAVPISSETQLLGVIALYGRTVPHPFTAVDLETVRSLARQAAVGVENVLLHQEAQRLSITDGLTSLWNYRFMNMRLAQEVERAIRFQRSLSVLVIDIDHFKLVNDRYGHQRGDAILAELANRIVTETRGQVDTVARYGGEEFVLILPETPIDGARVVAEKIRSSIRSRPFGGDDDEAITVTASIGIACFPRHGSTAQTLLRAADQALYEAKGRGRDAVVTADELDAPPPAPVADDPGRP